MFNISTKVDEDGEAHPLALVYKYLKGRKKLADRLFSGNTFPMIMAVQMLFGANKQAVEELIGFIHKSEPTVRRLKQAGALGTEGHIQTRYLQMKSFFDSVTESVTFKPMESALKIYAELMKDAPQMATLANLHISPSQMVDFFPAQFAALIDTLDSLATAALDLQDSGLEGARQIMQAQQDVVESQVAREVGILNKVAAAINASIVADAEEGARQALQTERNSGGIGGRIGDASGSDPVNNQRFNSFRN